jgi:hypothetical protein
MVKKARPKTMIQTNAHAGESQWTRADVMKESE